MLLLIFLLLIVWAFAWWRRGKPIEDGPERQALTMVGWGLVGFILFIALVMNLVD